MKRSTDYTVQIVDIDSIQPSPENDDIYGAVEMNDEMEALIESIQNRGLEEPIIVTSDSYVLSGHRRLFAMRQLEAEEVPIRINRAIKRMGHPNYHKALTEYNPQRVKPAASLLKEALLRFSDDDDDGTALLEPTTTVDDESTPAYFTPVEGTKLVEPISEKKQEFLEAAKRVVEDLRAFWPVDLRTVHYRLLNDPPRKLTPKSSKYGPEHYRYRNDKNSYEALSRLLVSARYLGEIPMDCINDGTRRTHWIKGWDNLSQFTTSEIRSFLVGYHRNRQQGQPRHIEVLGEKNTLLQIAKPICRRYYVPLTLGRGYSSPPVFRDIERRFSASGCERMTLLVLSDFDPEGFDLADSAVRTLRDLWDLPIDYHRVGVNREQIDELELSQDFNPAKESSSRLKAFKSRTGDKKTWELEALPPEYLQDQLAAAIEANLDMNLYRKVLDTEQQEAGELKAFRREIVEALGF